jgi:hypothetical protein
MDSGEVFQSRVRDAGLSFLAGVEQQGLCRLARNGQHEICAELVDYKSEGYRNRLPEDETHSHNKRSEQTHREDAADKQRKESPRRKLQLPHDDNFGRVM